MWQRTVVWLIYHQSECQEEAIFDNFPCASEIVSRQRVSVDPPERVALARRVVFYATPHNSWETLELGCPSNTLRTLYISCNHYFHIDYNAPCFPPPNFAQPLFPNSPGYYNHPKRNRKQLLCKVFFFFFFLGGGGETRCIMVYVKMVNTLLVPELLTSLSPSVGRWRRWRDHGPGNLTTDLPTALTE